MDRQLTVVKGYPKIDHDNAMGLVRYYLAIAVFIAHFNTVFGTDYYFPTSSYNAVGGFFSLSGFLVYGSYLKNRRLKNYLCNRARRILPPYLFIVFLAAFGLCLVSTLGVCDYFLNWHWVKYLVANTLFMNFLEPTLPGVFVDNDIHAVNGSLWTMKIEVMLYLSVPLVVSASVWLHRKGFSRLWLFAGIYLFSSLYRIVFHEMYLASGNEIYNILSRQVFGQLMYFYSGVFIYLNYDTFVKYRYVIFSAALIIMLGMDRYIPYYQFVISPAVVSVMVICVSLVKGCSVFNKNNISYDIYLCHFPVMQVVSYYLINTTIESWKLFLLTSILVSALSCISWFGIGRRFMRKKNYA